ncbi:hypothetical protein [Sorangium sp. So ce1182]|uniref:hypothetical protein n=1 Tax=Sorangium sp. So ce1182 TaxID=3133334 RepID=UPI003F621BD1
MILLTPAGLVVRIPYHHDGESNAMTRADVKSVVVDVLVRVVTAVGAPVPTIDDHMRPLGTLPSFDSILAEDTTVELFEQLGLGADLDVNPFIKTNRPASVIEVVDQLYELVNHGEQT